MELERVARVQTQVDNVVLGFLDALSFERVFFRRKVVQAAAKGPRI